MQKPCVSLKTTTTPCEVCGSSTPNNVCSQRCEQYISFASDFSASITKHVPDQDQRIFFHDIRFGDLVDMWTVHLLRRLHTKDLRKQQESDRVLLRLEKSIMTKVNRFCQSSPTRASVGRMVCDLAKVNAHMWELRNAIENPRGMYDERTRAESALRYFTASTGRDSLRHQLTFMVDGLQPGADGRIYD